MASKVSGTRRPASFDCQSGRFVAALQCFSRSIESLPSGSLLGSHVLFGFLVQSMFAWRGFLLFSHGKVTKHYSFQGCLGCIFLRGGGVCGAAGPHQI